VEPNRRLLRPEKKVNHTTNNNCNDKTKQRRPQEKVEKKTNGANLKV
jgi:hypothetical protein